MNKNYSLGDIQITANRILKAASNKCLLFYGEMGVGKTTLIKAMGKELSVIDNISSPTFSLVNQYKTVLGLTIYHFDFYRLEHEKEAFDLGFEDYFERDCWCFVEWPQNAKNLTPKNAVEIHLSLLENGERNVQLKTKL